MSEVGGAGPAPAEPRRPPPAVATTGAPGHGGTRLVLVRHGEAVCNVSGVVGGARGCSGLTPAGRVQVGALAERLAASGELGRVGALYASALPRAQETARLLAPALNRWRDGLPLEVRTDCALCELHPGAADGLTWEQFAARYEVPDWDVQPAAPLSPGGESWTAFVARAAGALGRAADAHPGETVVVATHAGVVEASMLRFLPADPAVVRLGLRTGHASMTTWERVSGRWLLERYNDLTPACPDPRAVGGAQQA